MPSTLAAVGIYAVLACAVAARTREIAVRVALGADRRHVATRVALEALSLVAVGLVVGLGAALAVGPLVSGLLYQVTPSDPTTFATRGGDAGVRRHRRGDDSRAPGDHHRSGDRPAHGVRAADPER